MKLGKKNFIQTISGIGVLSTLIPITLFVSSCSCSEDVSLNSTYQLYSEFVNGTHGRWSGNYANFLSDNNNDRSNDLTKNTFGQFGLNQKNLALAGFNNVKKIKPFLEFDKNKPLSNSDPDGIGSFYAYKWLISKLTDIGLKDLGGKYSTTQENPNYPNESNVELIIKNNKEKINLVAGSNAKLVDSAEGKKNIVSIFNDEDEKETPFQKTGFITQGFLWNGVDRITKKNVANQYDQNIIVTIKALDNNQNYKFGANRNQKTAFWICAHYDSTGTEGINSKSWGATDNGSGVGVALELINYYSKQENAKKLNCDLNIAFVGGEEVGISGSTALVEQYFTGNNSDQIIKNQIGGMINLDTTAGGDNIYVHSPWTTLYTTDNQNNLIVTKKQSEKATTNTLIRDQLNSISKMQSDSQNNQTNQMQIHPFIKPILDADGYLQGQTGDWSDHAPFYKTGISNIAYIEATNFQINGNTGYDGYSQTINEKCWIYKKMVFKENKWVNYYENDKLVTKQFSPIKTKLIDGQLIDVWGPDPNDLKVFSENNNKFKWERYNSGSIWHWDFDRFDFMKENFGDRMQNQLLNISLVLKSFFETLNISTFNSNLN